MTLLDFLLVILTIFTRFFGLKWGGGYFPHPDENNMAWAVGRIAFPKFDPDFFAYGHLPLYFTYGIYKIFLFLFTGRWPSKPVPFEAAVYILRGLSAAFSCLTVFFGYLLAKEIFKDKKFARIFSLFLIFTPGLIQSAHFGTTESALAFCAVALAYFSIRYFKMPKFKNLLSLVLVSAIGLSNKVSAALFLLAPTVAIIISFFNEKRRIKTFFGRMRKCLLTSLLFGLATLFVTICLSPYNLLRFKNFYGTVKYESEVAFGKSDTFYTKQFLETKPISFQMTKIFPWTLGLTNYTFTLLGILIILWKILRKIISDLLLMVKGRWSKRKERIDFILHTSSFILALAFLPWFLFNSFLYTKWTRFMLPILPFLVLPSVYFLKTLDKESKLAAKICLLLAILPGVIFMEMYFLPDIRLKTSQWMEKNFSETDFIFNESGNVVDLPIGVRKNLQIKNFDFYSLEEGEKSEERELELKDLIARADYILVPSRRIFANRLNHPDEFPKTAAYFRKLFTGNLGFIFLRDFRRFNFFEELLVGSDLNSEETWTVFDRPTARVFVRAGI